MRPIGIATLFFAGLCSVPAGAAAEEQTKTEEAVARPVTITFANVVPETGAIWVSVCTEAQLTAQMSGAGGECAANAIVDAAEGAEATFEGLAPGVYAASVFHDENGNGRLDFDNRGIPIEATGSSNNARGSFGPPTFAQMSFELGPMSADATPMTFTIELYKVVIDF
ncbi:MAG: DUF2141 domain-containing protein [Pseudomonadota bacterium]